MRGNDKERQRQRIEDKLIRNLDRAPARPSIGWPITLRELLRFRQPTEAFLLEGMIDGIYPKMGEAR